jgi:hypothetical protein
MFDVYFLTSIFWKKSKKIILLVPLTMATCVQALFSSKNCLFVFHSSKICNFYVKSEQVEILQNIICVFVCLFVLSSMEVPVSVSITPSIFAATTSAEVISTEIKITFIKWRRVKERVDPSLLSKWVSRSVDPNLMSNRSSITLDRIPTFWAIDGGDRVEHWIGSQPFEQ